MGWPCVRLLSQCSACPCTGTVISEEERQEARRQLAPLQSLVEAARQRFTRQQLLDCQPPLPPTASTAGSTSSRRARPDAASSSGSPAAGTGLWPSSRPLWSKLFSSLGELEQYQRLVGQPLAQVNPSPPLLYAEGMCTARQAHGVVGTAEQAAAEESALDARFDEVSTALPSSLPSLVLLCPCPDCPPCPACPLP